MDIQYLLSRKQTADSLAPEVRQRYAQEYSRVVAQLADYVHLIPHWDEEVNDEVLRRTLWDMSARYSQHGPYIEWISSGFIPEVDESWRTRDQARFVRAVMVARQQINNV